MANDLNDCKFVGRLGKDAECATMKNGKRVASFNLAVGKKWKDKESGQMKEHTEWIRCVAFERNAEIIEQYTQKGSQILVTGEMRTRKWQDNSGQDRYTTEIVVQKFQLLGGNQNNNSQSQNHQQTQQPQQTQQAQQTQQTQVDNFTSFDDDIPF